MATIAQTSNASGIWDGTATFDPDPAVDEIVLFCAAEVDQHTAYRQIKKITNSGPGPNALGPLTYVQLGLNPQVRKFFLRAVPSRSGKVDPDITAAGNPVLAVTPSTVPGYTLQQLQAMGIQPTVIVGFNPTTGLYHPVNVVPGTAPGFKLEI